MIDPKEKGVVHAEIQRVEFDPKTGKPLFAPYVYKAGVEDFKNFLNHPNGMTVINVLHVPEGANLLKNDGSEYEELKGKMPSGTKTAKSGTVSPGSGTETEETKDISKMKVEELDSMMLGLGLDPTGLKKAEKVEAILAAQSEEENS